MPLAITIILLYVAGGMVTTVISAIRGPYEGWADSPIPVIAITVFWPIGLPWYLLQPKMRDDDE